MRKKLPELNDLRLAFSYNETTGVLVRGDAVCGAGQKGKIVIWFKGKPYLAHRIIWKLVYGNDPDCVDHINGDQQDNRINNLRNVTQAQNNTNCRLRSDSSSGHAGVSWRKTRKKWRAYITIPGTNSQKNLGHFETREAAIRARRKAQMDAGYTFRHGV